MKPLLKDPEMQKLLGTIVSMFIVTWILMLIFALFGCSRKPEYPDCYLGSDYLVSDCEWTGCLDEDFIEQACYTNHIDPNGRWRIECPLCKTAYVEKTTNGDFPHDLSFCYFLGVALDLIREPQRAADYYSYGYAKVFCSRCLYPLGMDWRVFDWSL